MLFIQREAIMNFDDKQELILEVLGVEKEWVQAHRELDIQTLERIMAPDYTNVTPDGSVIGRDEDLASYRSGERKWEYTESDQYHVRVYGETAVLIGRWRAKGLNKSKIFDYSARFTSLYVKQDGMWRMAASQSTPIPEN
jgi:uncharacterized protein (TIGR02246 family)